MLDMQPGEHVTSTIKLVRLLSEGAMGCVWIAEHLALETLVAVKLMAPSYANDAKSEVRFRQEAQAAARLKSPHVTQVRDYGITAEGQPYIVMEFLEGETLRQRMQETGPMPIDEVVRLVRQTATALSEAHRLGIWHRDIKPDNLFVIDIEGEPFVKVLDFGIAKQVDAEVWVTKTGMTVGTPPYMSPEQFSNVELVDHRTDLWALGVVTYEALTGKQPFMGETVWALAMAVQKGVFPLPSALRSDLPAAMDAWMARALAVKVEARFGAAMDMAEALKLAAQRADEPRRGLTVPPRLRPGREGADTEPLEQVNPAPAAIPAERRMPKEGAAEAHSEDTIRNVFGRPPHENEGSPRRAAPPSREPSLQIIHDPVDDITSLSVPGLMPQAIAFDKLRAALFVGFDTGMVLSLDLTTKRPRWWCRIDASRRISPSARCITAGPGWLVVGCVSGAIHLLDPSRGTIEKTLLGHASSVRAVSMHQRGQLLAACGDDKLVTLWLVTTGERLHARKEHSVHVGSVAFDTSRFNTSTAMLASGANDATVCLWDEALQPKRVLRTDGSAVRSLSFSPGGHFLAAGCDDGGIRLWVTGRWELDKTLRGHKKGVVSVVFAPRADIMLSGSFDGTVRTWGAASGETLRILGEYAGAIECVATSPDGRHAASACADGTVRIYRSPWKTSR